MVSWMAAIASLRYFLLIFHLDKIAILDQHRDLFVGQPQHVMRRLLELFLFCAGNVRPVILGETIGENCACALAEEDDGSIAARFALPWSGNPLFDDPAAQIGINLSVFSTGRPPTPERCRRSF